ncbi:MAG TPA: sigma-70 family RNA polymerase sigma factor [Phycisphaerae bacterium]|nr:sigma-70 family RNA polymerase sigma factor [Phycisphaerae bacterium]
MTDLELLQQYVLGSQDAFAELARRHAHWVYSAARRMLRDGHLAEDVTQAVFIILSQKARGLVRKRSLHGWLFKTTRYTAANALRSQSRRKSHERRAAQMHEASSTDHSQRQPKHHQQDEDFCKQIAPHLEEMVARMRRDDRDALLLRYYRQMSLADVGAALGVSEDTARKRVSRAIQSLRELLRRHGTDIPAGALAGPLLSMTTQPAPPALVTACGAPLATGAGAAAGMIAQGALLMAGASVFLGGG